MPKQLLFLYFIATSLCIKAGNVDSLLAHPPNLKNATFGYVDVSKYQQAIELEAKTNWYLLQTVTPKQFKEYSKKAKEILNKSQIAKDKLTIKILDILNANGKLNEKEILQLKQQFLKSKSNQKSIYAPLIAFELVKHYLYSDDYYAILEQIYLFEKLIKQQRLNVKVYDEQKRISTAITFYKIGLYNEALKEYKKAYSKQFDDPYSIAQVILINDIAQTFEKLKISDSVKVYISKARRLADKLLLKSIINENMHLHLQNIITITETRNIKPQPSREMIISSYKNLRKTASLTCDAFSLLISNYQLSNQYYKSNELDKSLIHIKAMNQILEGFINKEYKEKGILLLEKILIKQKRYAEADRENEKFEALSLQNSLEKATYLISDLQSKMKLNKEEERLLQIEEKNKKQENLFIAASIALGVISLFLLFGYFAYNRKKEAEKIIRNQNIELSRNVEEKEMLLREIHHRVKNNLQVINGFLILQANSSKNEEAISQLQDTQKRINAFATIHEQLYQKTDITLAEMQTYIERLGQHQLMLSKVPVDFEVNANNIKLSMDDAIHLGLLLNELLTNSIKYAFLNKNSGKISIQLSYAQDHFKLYYSDSGPGASLNSTSKSSLGTRIIDMMAKQLNGNTFIEEKDGFHYTLNFNIK